MGGDGVALPAESKYGTRTPQRMHSYARFLVRDFRLRLGARARTFSLVRVAAARRICRMGPPALGGKQARARNERKLILGMLAYAHPVCAYWTLPQSEQRTPAAVASRARCCFAWRTL